jgi:hypothetical protein
LSETNQLSTREQTDTRAAVEVAVGILQRDGDATVLLAQRPEGKP